MAKKKITDASPTDVAPKTPAPKKPAAKAAKKSAPAAVAPQRLPLIDTSAAAAAAARMVGGGLAGTAAADPRAPKATESATFRQIKAGVQKPGAPGGATGGLAGIVGPAKKLGSLPLGHQGKQQVGHNQTFGADVNRSYVPRRTGG